MRRRFPPCCAAALLAASLSSAQEQPEATVDANPIGIEDELLLTVAVPGDDDNRMELPVLDDFDLAGSGRTFRTSLVNGRMRQTVEWNFTLRPRRTGDLRIPPIAVPGFRPTEEIAVRVEDGSLRPRRPRRDPFGSLFGAPVDPFDPFDRRALSARPPADVGEGEVFVLAETPGHPGGEPEVFVGEQVLVLYRLYSRLPVAAAGAVEMTDAEGFWTEEVTLPDVPWQEQGLDRAQLARRRALPGPRRERRTIGGVAYETWPVLLRAVFPTGAGERLLPGPRFQVMVESRRTSFFGPDRAAVVRDAPAVTVRAREIPAAGRPSGWAGAVGDYELRAEILREGEPLEGTTAAAGEPLVLRLELSGVGNLRAAGTPGLPDTPEFRRAFRAFDPDTSTELGLAAAGGEYSFGGRRLWEFPLVPEAGGVRRIPEIALDAFDPRTGSYRRLATDPLELTIEGASAAAPGAAGPVSVERFGEDIRYLKPVAAGGRAASPWRPGAGFFLLLALPFAWNGAVFFFRRRRAYRSRHAARFRREGAARSALAALRRVGGDGGAEAAAAVAGILTGYAADRFSVSARGLTPSAAADRLVEAGAAPETARRFAALLSRAESARYAAGPAAAAPGDSPAGEAAALIRSLEAEISGKTREPGGGSGGRRVAGTAASVALVLCASFATGLSASAADPEEAARRYDAGDYREAAEIWRELLREADSRPGDAAAAGEGSAAGAGWDRAALHYNLGNAEFRDGRLGHAMLHWERSLRIRPGDAEARANLALARSLLDRRLTAAAASAEGDAAPGSPAAGSPASADAFALELLRSMEGFTAGVRRVPPSRFGLSLAGAALLGGALATLLLFRVGPRRLFVAGLAAAVLSAGVSGFVLRLALTAPPLAVVVRPAAALRSGPGPAFPQLASLPEGLYVEVGEGEAATAGSASPDDGYLRVVAAGIVGFAARDAVVPVAVNPVAVNLTP